MILLNMLESLEQMPTIKNRLVFSFFALLIFVLLLYFWYLSRSKLEATKKDGSGLVYLSIAYFLYFILGGVSVRDSLIELDLENQAVPVYYVIISSLASLCLLSSLSFFSIGTHRIDRIVSLSGWKNGIKYIGFAWIILMSIIGPGDLINILEKLLGILAFLVLGFFLTRYFWKRQLNFIAAISVGFFVGIILLQLFNPYDPIKGRFVDMNTLLLMPAMALSVIFMSYTFNWINELNFYELSSIWVGNSNDQNGTQEEAYSKLTVDNNKGDWMEKIASDEIEKVIEEIIILKKHRNENLETILNIASRNTRNNNNHIKSIITYEDYQLNRNKVSNSLMTLLNG